MADFRSGKPYALGSLGVDTVVAAGLQPLPLTVLESDPAGYIDGLGVDIERPGFYLCIASAGRAAVASSSQPILRIRRNGLGIASCAVAGTASSTVITTSRYLELDEGDRITAEAQLHATLAATWFANATYLNVVRLGPVRWT